MGTESPWAVRAVAGNDASQWRELYGAYRSFYAMPDDEAALDLVWEWLVDPAHEVSGFVAVDADGRVGGLANVRTFARPLSAGTGLYLDDLFVAPDLRGRGIGRVLLGFLGEHAAERGWGVVRWITDGDNVTARALYDSVATATPWVTYDLVPRPPA